MSNKVIKLSRELGEELGPELGEFVEHHPRKSKSTLSRKLSNTELSQLVGAALKMPHVTQTIFYINKKHECTFADTSTKLVERRVAELKSTHRQAEITTKNTDMYPDYTTDMNTAWKLVETMKKQSLYIDISNGYDSDIQKDMIRAAVFDKTRLGIIGSIHRAGSTHAPTAVLLAVAKTLGVYSE